MTAEGRDGVLPAEVRERLRAIEHADLLVGIPSYNSARTIAHVVRAVTAGLVKYFPDRRALLVNSDGGSKDGTREIVAETELPDVRHVLVSHPVSPIHKIVAPYEGTPGKGSAFRMIFGVAEALGVKACAVVDSDLRSITPEWVELLLRPVLDHGYDFVAPYYLRHKYDGTITNSIVYPLTRALYGKTVRQPIGGEFGFSGRLAAHFLTRDVWDGDVARFGIDVWMTTTAIADRFSVCQAYLGAKIHDAKDPGADLASMFSQVVSSVFDLMSTHETTWRSRGPGSEEVPLFGLPFAVGVEPVQVDVRRMLASFRQGLRDLAPVWRPFLPAGSLARLQAAAADEPPAFRFPDDLWADVVYDFAVAHRNNVLPRGQLLASMVPLYLGRTASFVLAMETAGPDEVERAIEGLAGVFEERKPYLLERWPAA